MVFYITEKLDLFLFLKKKHAYLLWRGSHSQNSFMLHESNKTNNKTTIHDLFLYLKNLHALKKSNLYLKKNTNQFWCEKNLYLHLRKMQIPFILKKNSDLHLGKMQICFIWRKIQIYIERYKSVLFWKT